MTTRRPALFLLGLAALAAPAALSGCSRSEDSWPDRAGLHVVVTLPALDSFVRKVAGDHATVKCLAEGPGNDVEDYEPSAEDAAQLRRADVLFINGLHFDDGPLDTFRLNGANPNLKVVALGDAVPQAERRKRSDGTDDPHVWLAVTQAKEMVQAVRDQLKQMDPEHAADYDANAENYRKELDDLYQDGQAAVAKMNEKDRTLVCLHDSLTYFAPEFGLKIAGVVKVEPGEEPSPSRYERIARLCMDDKVRLVAVPRAYPEATAKTIHDELWKRGAHDVDFVVIDPLESADDLSSADWYKKQMENNFDALRKTAPK